MSERLILKVKLNLIVVWGISLDDVEENFNGSLGDGLVLRWLREFHVVPTDHELERIETLLTVAHFQSPAWGRPA